jgi:hypothetical protein
MNIISKVLIPNKEWIIEDQGEKIGSVAKLKKGYEFFRHGKKINFKDLKEFTNKFGVDLVEEKKVTAKEIKAKVKPTPVAEKAVEVEKKSKPRRRPAKPKKAE